MDPIGIAIFGKIVEDCVKITRNLKYFLFHYLLMHLVEHFAQWYYISYLSFRLRFRTNIQRGWHMICSEINQTSNIWSLLAPDCKFKVIFSKAQLYAMATASDKLNQNGRARATEFQIFSLFLTSTIHNQVRELKQNFACLILGLSMLWWYVAATPVFFL